VKLRSIHTFLYFINATVLLLHQIDAAYWHEWRLFALPGGIQLFLALNGPMVALLLWGFRQVVLGSASGPRFSWVLVGCGLFAAGFHTFFLMRGDEAFRLPFSLGLLIATLLLSCAQGLALWLRPANELGQ
jgi:hypothetical protein